VRNSISGLAAVYMTPRERHGLNKDQMLQAMKYAKRGCERVREGRKKLKRKKEKKKRRKRMLMKLLVERITM